MRYIVGRITTGSVWSALIDDPIEARRMERKSVLLMKVQERLKTKKWTQVEAARHLGVQQPRISDLQKGKISQFSMEMLIDFLEKLGQPVEITFPKKRGRARPEKLEHA
jgi:predicted XRE-type DNA-binding protein